MSAPKPTDIRLETVSFRYEDFRYRTPIKFGGVAVDRASVLNVDCAVRTVAGTPARGFGSMPLGNVWAFPSRVLSYDDTLAAMKALAERIARWGFRVIDAQVPTPHTVAMGAVEWPRKQFLEVLRRELAHPTRKGSWAQGEPPLEP